MTDRKETVRSFVLKLEALCREYDVNLQHEDGHGSAYLVRAEPGQGGLEISFLDSVQEPSQETVRPLPTPEELAQQAASRETWEAGFKRSEHACLECGIEGRTHLPFCSNEGGGVFGYKIEVTT